MRRRFAVLLLAALSAGCNRPEIVTAVDHDFNLAVGGQALLPKDHLEVGFARVLNDSRCPEGAACAQAGEAVLAMWMGREGGKSEVFEARLPATVVPDSGAVVEHGDYRLRLFELDPRPRVSETLDTTAYKLKLRVSRR
jgi:hypothetical protein